MSATPAARRSSSCPGELLPAWVAEQMNEGKAPLDDVTRVRTLQRKQAKGKQ